MQETGPLCDSSHMRTSKGWVGLPHLQTDRLAHHSSLEEDRRACYSQNWKELENQQAPVPMPSLRFPWTTHKALRGTCASCELCCPKKCLEPSVFFAGPQASLGLKDTGSVYPWENVEWPVPTLTAYCVEHSKDPLRLIPSSDTRDSAHWMDSFEAF